MRQEETCSAPSFAVRFDTAAEPLTGAGSGSNPAGALALGGGGPLDEAAPRSSLTRPGGPSGTRVDGDGTGAADPRPEDPAGERGSTVSVQLVHALADAVERAGVPRNEFLHAALSIGVPLERGDARVPRSQIGQLCERALDLTGDPALGLHWGLADNSQSFAPVSYLIAHSATLRRGLEALSRFEALLTEGPIHELQEEGDRAILRCRPWARKPAHLLNLTSEMIVGGHFRLIRYFDAKARVEQVNFEYPAPAHRDEYTKVFGDSVSFDQAFSGLVFDRKLLDAPSPHRDLELRDALRVVTERRVLSQAERAPYALKVRACLLQYRRPHQTTMAAVARSLGVSVRSLQRRLAAEGRSYPALQNDAMAVVLKRLLREERLSIKQTAYELGFSSTSPFHRAFKRWTGTTPRAFRNA